ncbi:MAG TPA: ABC transporter substrate-binding protein [Xanthobacteraceae bacterium]|nr:ABC transporter substrate-binding protein [Xanthobacteraceae bacterium]
MRKRAGAAALIGALTMATAAAAQTTAIKVGISEPVNTVLAMWMADAAGVYAARGLEVEIINMSGGSHGAQELAAGHIDVMHVGLSSVVRLNRAGADLRFIASLSNVIRFTFFSSPGVRTAADLKGGTVGVSTFGSESDATVTLALQRLGLARADVTLKEYGGGMKRIAAVQAGEIKATAVNEPVTSIARERGLFPLVDLVAEHIPWLFSGIVVKKDFLDAHRDTLKRFLLATVEGNDLALADASRAKAVLARETRTADPKVLDISYEDFRAQSPANLAPARAGADNIIAQFPAEVSRRVEDYVDGSLLDELEADGALAALQQKYGR